MTHHGVVTGAPARGTHTIRGLMAAQETDLVTALLPGVAKGFQVGLHVVRRNEVDMPWLEPLPHHPIQ